jgi:hypothetical protein
MRKLSYFFSIAVLAGMVAISGCKKDDPEPTEVDPDAPVVNVSMTTNNGGNTGAAIASLEVSTSTGTAVIRLDVISTVDLDRIYIVKSEDNGSLQPLSFTDIKTADGKTFSGGSSNYSFKVPSNTKNFTLDVPVSVRSNASAVTDAYQIWITNGAGDFLIPTKKRELGPAVVTLKYGAAVSANTYTRFTGVVANQQGAEGSFIVTSGQGGVIKQADYRDDNNPENAKSVDISFASLNTALTALGTDVNALVSPSERQNVGFSASNEPSAANVNTTYFGAWSGTAFASATAADLAGISGLSVTKIAVVDGGTYAFETQAGKKGLINIGTVSNSGSGKKFDFTIKVLN